MSGNHSVCPAERAGFLTSRLRYLIHNPKKIVGRYISPGCTAVDIGCGPGFFTCPMAGMTGEEGRVIAVDLQEGMLARLSERAAGMGLLSRIDTCLANSDSLNLQMEGEADFVLAFYMVHEVPDEEGLFEQLSRIMKPGGKLLVIEPALHVSAGEFEKTVELALANGFGIIESSRGFFDRSAIFVRK